ncbi:KaiB domain protein [Solidesulfovibrio fructosivorans JJ]]|uniref:KaiB domain protein n=1 Tax=Solidesulfovibrio fructosivorans JJ] TaxID=596151 RepID=E1K214_SOLFR|nr:hypothetical protein [Solidesulfovibrio fructosivorans]EFL49327.1 KaiB domain protein [Solidesulfovibrio fructosivorans JJ]]
MSERLILYLAGKTSGNSRLEAALRDWCDRFQPGRFRLEVVDVEKWSPKSRPLPVLAVPALALGATGRMFVGDFSNIASVMTALGCLLAAS